MNPVEVIRGESPIILCLPHTGTWLPDGIRARLNARGQILADTDWHVERLYDGLLPGATTVRATFHRYVIDANRSPSDESLYPGQNTTGLVPVTDFNGEPIWIELPRPVDITVRTVKYHTPYHAALAAEIQRVKARHGVAILYDCHSIRSHIPFLFEGVLPDFNIGTNGGASCDPRIESIIREICLATGRPMAVNGRFKGGWTTRHYGQPRVGVHAIQMELAQSTYLASESPPFAYDDAKAEALRKPLREILLTLATFAADYRSWE